MNTLENVIKENRLKLYQACKLREQKQIEAAKTERLRKRLQREEEELQQKEENEARHDPQKRKAKEKKEQSWEWNAKVIQKEVELETRNASHDIYSMGHGYGRQQNKIIYRARQRAPFIKALFICLQRLSECQSKIIENYTEINDRLSSIEQKLEFMKHSAHIV